MKITKIMFIPEIRWKLQHVFYYSIQVKKLVAKALYTMIAARVHLIISVRARIHERLVCVSFS
jgi:hypothetical protein